MPHTAMDLILSHNRPLNTALCNAEGKPLYVVRTPPGFAHTNTTVISRVSHDLTADKYIDLDIKYDDEDEEDGEPGAEYHHLVVTEELAKIHWKMADPSILEYRGETIDSNDYLHPEGILGFDRSFTASDGKRYKWVAGITTYSTIALYTDPAKTPIAHHYRSNSGFIGPKHKAHLKIFPEGMHIIDDIVVTFIYMDKVRKTRQRMIKVA